MNDDPKLWDEYRRIQITGLCWWVALLSLVSLGKELRSWSLLGLTVLVFAYQTHLVAKAIRIRKKLGLTWYGGGEKRG